MKDIKFIFILVFVVGISLWLCARDLTLEEIDKKFFKKNFLEINEVFAIPTLLLNETMVYIVDLKQCRVFIFNKKEGKKIAVCGNHGEGPAEFTWITGSYCDEKKLYICSPQKVTIFSKEGQLLKEYRLTILDGHTLIPFGQNYIYDHRIHDQGGTSYFAYSILDQHFKEVKTIFKDKYFIPVTRDKTKEAISPFNECRKGIIYKDRFYLGFSDRGFYLAVFDNDGNRLYYIEKKYDKIPLNSETRQRILSQMKRYNPENFEKMMSRSELILQDYLPAFLNFYIYNDIIILFRYPRPGVKGMAEVLLLDLKGNIIGEKTILLGNFPFILNKKEIHCYYNGKIYFVIDFDEKLNIAEFSLDDFIGYYFGVGKSLRK